MQQHSHEAIIDRETFDYVQAEMARRKELGPLANKALNTCCFTGRIKCSLCGQSYMHTTRVNRATRTLQPEKVESWSCGTRKKKDGHCKGKEIPHRILLTETSAVLGLDEFDEQVFAEQIERIDVTGDKEMTFRFKDGHAVVRQWVNTSKKDCWTPEYRAEASAYRRNHVPNRSGVTCFTTKIKCATCGNNYCYCSHSLSQNCSVRLTWNCSARCHGLEIRKGARQSESPYRSMSDFMFKNEVHYVVNYQLALELECVHEAAKSVGLYRVLNGSGIAAQCCRSRCSIRPVAVLVLGRNTHRSSRR